MIARSPAGAYLLAVGAVAAATALGIAATPYASHADQAMLYLLAVMVAALRRPRARAHRCRAVRGRVRLLLRRALSHVRRHRPPLPRHVRGDARDRHRDRRPGQRGSARVEAESHEREIRARAEELRSTLLSSVSHDLRTPLAVITGMATCCASAPTGQRPRVARHDRRRGAAALAHPRRTCWRSPRSSPAPSRSREWMPLEELVGSALERLEPRARAVARHARDQRRARCTSTRSCASSCSSTCSTTRRSTRRPGCAIAVRARSRRAAAVVEVRDRGPGCRRDRRNRCSRSSSAAARRRRRRRTWPGGLPRDRDRARRHDRARGPRRRRRDVPRVVSRRRRMPTQRRRWERARDPRRRHRAGRRGRGADAAVPVARRSRATAFAWSRRAARRRERSRPSSRPPRSCSTSACPTATGSTLVRGSASGRRRR